MKNFKSKECMKKVVKLSATFLPMLALSFAAAPCIFKMYEPKVPEQLVK